jgi:hypothetical protein
MVRAIYLHACLSLSVRRAIWMQPLYMRMCNATAAAAPCAQQSDLKVGLQQIFDFFDHLFRCVIPFSVQFLFRQERN